MYSVSSRCSPRSASLAAPLRLITLCSLFCFRNCPILVVVEPPPAAAALSLSLTPRFHTFLLQEVLAPAGGWPQLQAAVQSGADAVRLCPPIHRSARPAAPARPPRVRTRTLHADPRPPTPPPPRQVYFGLSDFNARARAANFDPAELPAVMDYLHQHGVKGFVALNILVFDTELAAVEERVRAMARAGVDAVIVQDLGAVRLMRAAAPSLPVHGSTQMSVTSPEGAEFARRLGCDRVVAGRELSIRELAAVRRGCSAELEAFCHGALCVSYSGQCFSSEAWGGRSANRGQCAQACRMPYGLVADGLLKDLGDYQYLLSPQDLSALEHVPELIDAGVSCLKIEGRLKARALSVAVLVSLGVHPRGRTGRPRAAELRSTLTRGSPALPAAGLLNLPSPGFIPPAFAQGPEYVAVTTSLYRRAVDAAWAALQEQEGQGQQGRDAAGPGPSSSSAERASALDRGRISLTQQERWDLQQVFARGQDSDFSGLTPGFLEGPQHQRLVRGRSPRHRGVFVGTVERVLKDAVHVRLQARPPGLSAARLPVQQAWGSTRRNTKAAGLAEPARPSLHFSPRRAPSSAGLGSSSTAAAPRRRRRAGPCTRSARLPRSPSARSAPPALPPPAPTTRSPAGWWSWSSGSGTWTSGKSGSGTSCGAPRTRRSSSGCSPGAQAAPPGGAPAPPAALIYRDRDFSSRPAGHAVTASP